jgi:hypothetical protein
MSRSPIHAVPPPPPKEEDRRPLSGVFDNLVGAVLKQTASVERLVGMGTSLTRLGLSLLVVNVVMTVLMALAVVALWRH